MLVVMFYMIVVPLYRMVEITLTWQPHDLTRVPDAVVGKFTTFHYSRMLTGLAPPNDRVQFQRFPVGSLKTSRVWDVFATLVCYDVYDV